MEQARRSALAHHVHRTAPMGPRVLINGIWYKRIAKKILEAMGFELRRVNYKFEPKKRTESNGSGI
jgi:hypothetical protein